MLGKEIKKGTHKYNPVPGVNDNLTITLVQETLAWGDIERNLARFDTILTAMEEQTRLIVLPEMFTTGFCIDRPELAQKMDGSAVLWMRQKAKEKGVDLVGSVLIKENGHLFNRLIWACATGEIHLYDKHHLFGYAGETKFFTPGTQRLIVQVDGWNISPFICYDLRFPCWIRNLNNAYDLAIFVASWPASRSAHWKALLGARAIENQSYVLGVNRVGTDGNGMIYSGDSSVVDPQGTILFHKSQSPVVHTITLSHTLLMDYRRCFPFWMDADL